jgi:hypothetical protein
MMRCLAVLAALTLGACALGGPVRPTYEFEASYAPNVAPPMAIAADLEAYASQICGAVGYDVLDQIFVGEYGPGYVRIRFACS